MKLYTSRLVDSATTFGNQIRRVCCQPHTVEIDSRGQILAIA